MGPVKIFLNKYISERFNPFQLVSILIVTIIIFNCGLVNAQTPFDVKDSIKSVTFQKVKIPGDKNFSFVDIVDFHVTSSVYDSEGNFIKYVDECIQYPDRKTMLAQVKKANGRGTAVQASCFVSVEKPGQYFIESKFKVKNEKNRIAQPSVVYLLDISYPTISSEIRLRDKYYFTEKLSFSIATLEFNEPNQYSYQIIDKSTNKVIISEKNSLIKLDGLFADINNVGKSFIIKGLYKGNSFNYLYNGDKQPRYSEWEISLEKPSPAKLGDWVDPLPDGVARVITADNPSARKILYTLNAKTPDNQYVFVKPMIRNLKVSSNPPGIFENGRTVTLGAFDYIYFDYNQEFYEVLEYEGQDVELTVEFTNVFGDREKFTSNGIIIK